MSVLKYCIKYLGSTITFRNISLSETCTVLFNDRRVTRQLQGCCASLKDKLDYPKERVCSNA